MLDFLESNPPATVPLASDLVCIASQGHLLGDLCSVQSSSATTVPAEALKEKRSAKTNLKDVSLFTPGARFRLHKNRHLC